MKLITRVNLELKYLVGEKSWGWIASAIQKWEEKGEKDYVVCQEWPHKWALPDYRSLKRKGEWWLFTHTEDGFSNEWQMRETPMGWEWNYTTQSGLGHYEYRFVTVGYNSIVGPIKEGRLTFDGRRNSLKMGTNFFILTEEKVEAWRYSDYAVPHQICLTESSTPERGAWD